VKLVLTNDDGVESPGIHALAAGLRDLGHTCTVVAPARDMSGSSAAIGRLEFGESMELTPVALPAPAEGIEAFSVDGPPGLAALLAATGAFAEPPDLVVSGINAGPNTGHSILHSGTVGAALTAASFGVSALAVSLDVSDSMPWRTACAYLPEALEHLTAAPVGTVLNLNVPAVAEPQSVRGLRWATLDQFGSFRVAVADRHDTLVQLEYRATGAELDPDSDTALLAAGWATLTAIRGIGEIPPDEIAAQEERRTPEPRLATVPKEDAEPLPERS